MKAKPKLVAEVREGLAEADARRCRELREVAIGDVRAAREGRHRCLTKWELHFVVSLSDQIADGARLTPVQRKKLEEVHRRVFGERRSHEAT